MSFLQLFSQSNYKLLCQKNKNIYTYDLNKNKFDKLLELKFTNRAAIEQNGDTLSIYDFSDDYYYIVNLSKNNIKEKVNKNVPHNKFYFPIIYKNKVLRKDTFINKISYSTPPLSFSCFFDEKIIWAKRGNIYLFNGIDTIRYLKHYVKFSFLKSYNSWGYFYPEISKDNNILYFIDTYKFKYENKHKHFNRIKDEKYWERKYLYLIIMNFKTKTILKTIKIPFVQVGSVYSREYRNLQLSPDNKYLFFEAYPNSFLYDTENEKITQLPEGYFYVTWLK